MNRNGFVLLVSLVVGGGILMLTLQTLERVGQYRPEVLSVELPSGHPNDRLEYSAGIFRGVIEGRPFGPIYAEATSDIVMSQKIVCENEKMMAVAFISQSRPISLCEVFPLLGSTVSLAEGIDLANVRYSKSLIGFSFGSDGIPGTSDDVTRIAGPGKWPVNVVVFIIEKGKKRPPVQRSADLALVHRD